MSDLFKRRLEGAMEDAADVAEDMATDRGVPMDPGMVGKMGLALFQARMTLLFHNVDGDVYDFDLDEMEDGRMFG